MKILVCGGHLSPAVTFIKALQATSHQAIFVGLDDPASGEKKAIESLSVPFYPIKAVKYHRYQPFQNLLNAFFFFPSILSALKLISTHQPDLILGFGGYVSLPLSLAARILHRPVMIHEQTAVAGLANQLIARFAAAVAISFPQSRLYFHSPSIHLVGNLLRPEIYASPKLAPPWMPPSSRLPLLYITGGHLGSLALNRLIASLYPVLTKEYFVVHQTGDNPLNPFSSEACLQASHLLPSDLQDRLLIKPFFNSLDASWLFHQAHLIISRAGANTVCEIIWAQVPSVLVPLPGTHLDEQTQNAQVIAKAHGGLIISQNSLNQTNLLNALQCLNQDYSAYVSGLRTLKPLINFQAAGNLIKLAEKIVNSRRYHP